MNYEFHVTVDVGHENLAAAEAHAELVGFKSSYIKNDPLLGDRTFFYYTGHTDSVESAKALMEKVNSLPYDGKIVRRKIELIVYDTKTGVGV